MRVIGMDIHRTFAEAVMIDGDKLIRLGRVNMSREHLAAFAAKLTHDDHIVIEATGNAQAVVEAVARSEEHTSELQSLMRISYAVFCLKKKKQNNLHDLATCHQ